MSAVEVEGRLPKVMVERRTVELAVETAAEYVGGYMSVDLEVPEVSCEELVSPPKLRAAAVPGGMAGSFRRPMSVDAARAADQLASSCNFYDFPRSQAE